MKTRQHIAELNAVEFTYLAYELKKTLNQSFMSGFSHLSKEGLCANLSNLFTVIGAGVYS